MVENFQLNFKDLLHSRTDSDVFSRFIFFGHVMLSRHISVECGIFHRLHITSNWIMGNFSDLFIICILLINQNGLSANSLGLKLKKSR